MKATSIFDLLAILITLALFVVAVIASIDVVTAQTPSPAQGGDVNGEHRGPPPEAIAACKTAKPDQACSFTAPVGTVTGNCWQPDANHPLACRPERWRPGTAKSAGPNAASQQPHAPPPEALAACQGHKPYDACSFTSPQGSETGSCFQPDSSRPLACRPARG
jgi:hypothetical protein